MIPTQLNDDWNLINRTIIPVLNQPVTNGKDQTGLGDITWTGFFSPTDSGVTWGVGPSIIVPSATDDALGSGKVSLGPGVVVLAMQGPWVYGGLVQNWWSVGGSDSRADVNNMLLNPFVNYNFSKGWYVSSSPNIIANWEANSDNTWLIPVGGGVGRVFHIGKQAVNAKLSYYYNVERPSGGPDQQIQFQFTFLLPK